MEKVCREVRGQFSVVDSLLLLNAAVIKQRLLGLVASAPPVEPSHEPFSSWFSLGNVAPELLLASV